MSVTAIHQAPPFRIEVEVTLGCNLRCEFCGNRGIKDVFNVYKYLSLETAHEVCQQIKNAGWQSAIHFSGRGEPTRNPNLLVIIAEFRRALPGAYLLMSTNGSGFLETGVQEVFRAGLNCVSLDEYVGIGWAKTVRQKIRKSPPQDIAVYEYPNQPKGNPMHVDRKQKRLCIVAPINKNTKGIISKHSLTNRCGAAGPLDFRLLRARCALPFRQMSVRHDGNVVICCHDWRGTYKLGNVAEIPIDKIWNGPGLQAARRRLYHHQRNFPPCLGCNNRSVYVGWLPDQFGKETLPPPDDECQRIIEKTIAGPTLTPAETREWDGKPILYNLLGGRTWKS